MSQMVTNLVEQCISVSHKTSIKKIFNIILLYCDNLQIILQYVLDQLLANVI